MFTVTAKVADRTPIYLRCKTEWGTTRKYVFGWPAARRKAAWWIVFERYGGHWDARFDNFARTKDFPPRFACECGDLEEYGDKRTDCPIHDPDTGYLRRLHDRVVRWLAAGYILPDSGLREE